MNYKKIASRIISEMVCGDISGQFAVDCRIVELLKNAGGRGDYNQVMKVIDIINPPRKVWN